MKKINCLGQMCPIPIIHLQNQIPNIQKGEIIMIVTDHSCTLSSIKDFCKIYQFSHHADEVITGVWEITVCKPL